MYNNHSLETNIAPGTQVNSSINGGLRLRVSSSQDEAKLERGCDSGNSLRPLTIQNESSSEEELNTQTTTKKKTTKRKKKQAIDNAKRRKSVRIEERNNNTSLNSSQLSLEEDRNKVTSIATEKTVNSEASANAAINRIPKNKTRSAEEDKQETEKPTLEHIEGENMTSYRKRVREFIRKTTEKDKINIPKKRKIDSNILSGIFNKRPKIQNKIRNVDISRNRKLSDFRIEHNTETENSTPINIEYKKCDNFTIMTVNTRHGLWNNIYEVIEEANRTKIDIIFITETGLQEHNMRNQRLAAACAKYDFRFFPAAKVDNKCAHTAIIIKNTIKINKIKLFDDTGRLIHMEIDTEENPINLLGIYQSHNSAEKDKIHEIVEKWLEEYRQKNRIVLGDFNEIVSELDYAADYIQNKRSKGQIHHILERQGMIDIIRARNPTTMEHTRVGTTTDQRKSFSRIDYIYCDAENLEKCTNSKTMYNSKIISDHMPIYATFLAKTILEKDTDEDVKIQRNASQKSWEKWRIQTTTSLKIREKEIHTKLKSGNINQINAAIQIFTDIMIHEARRNLLKEHTENPVILAIRDDSLLHKLRKEEMKERKLYNTQINRNKDNLLKCQKAVIKRRKEIVKEKNIEKWEHTLDQIKKAEKSIFNLLKKSGKKANRCSEKPSMVKLMDGIVVADPENVKKEFARQWKETFSTKGEKPQTDTPWLELIKGNKYNKILDITISTYDVKTEISKLKSGKATGPEKVSNELLNNMNEYMVKLTTEILEAVRKSRQIPNIWKESTTVLLYKGKENRADPMAYRPIALLSCIYKIYSAIQNNRLIKWMEDNNIHSENQHGFRRGTDTADAAAEILACIEHALKTGNKIHVAFLDVAKAYDSVEHWSMKDSFISFIYSHKM